ncbi:MAG TPA: 3-hydroxy-3-methylglutaryl-CoA reductase, partial [Candidatus Bathyarchaeota archaeon]|nr:3-hydroxy-3-methylglutaryl-CoA reductase [Candidatus Bathyarchaeota archaeon]
MADIKENIVEKLLKGEIKLYQVERLVGNDVNKAAEIRRKMLEKKLGIGLSHIGFKPIDLNLTFMKNIENAIGVAQIPMGVVGPLKVKGDYADGEYYV